MRAKIIKIGNSQGLCLPKALIEQCGFGKSVQIRVEGNCLIIEPVPTNRAGWEQSFETMAAIGDDAALLDESAANRFDTDEWAW